MALSAPIGCGLIALITLLPAPLADQPPGHLFGETAIDQYVQVHFDGESLTIQVDTDYAELPGAQQRQRFDRDGDGLLSPTEHADWQRAALQFALAHTHVHTADGPLPLRAAAAPQVDWYDFAQTGAKPVREVVYLQAAWPGAEIEPVQLRISTSFRPPSRRHVSRIFATASAPWRVISADQEEDHGDGLSYDALRQASRSGVFPPGFIDRAVYQRELRFEQGEALEHNPADESETIQASVAPEASVYRHWSNHLGELLFDRERAVVWWFGVVLAVFYGMGHALAPGHGKALIAAWLMGRRGSLLDALVAGTAATLSHTVVVFALGFALSGLRLLTIAHLEALDGWISLSAGLLILGMGWWLWSRARSHGGGHHHGHDHRHHALPDEYGRPRQAGLVGFLAGIAPCPAGVLIVVFAASQQAPLLGLFYAFIFSLGMASVLVAIAMAVTLGMRLHLTAHPALHRLLGLAPLWSALVVMALGFWLAADAAGRLGLLVTT